MREGGREGVHENCAQGRNSVSRHGKTEEREASSASAAAYLLMNRNRVAVEGGDVGSKRAKLD